MQACFTVSPILLDDIDRFYRCRWPRWHFEFGGRVAWNSASVCCRLFPRLALQCGYIPFGPELRAQTRVGLTLTIRIFG